MDEIKRVQSSLAASFKLKVLGDLHYFLGLEIARSFKGIHLCQRKYVLQLLQDTGFISTKPSPIPMDPRTPLNTTDGEPLTDVPMYHRLIGRLMYPTLSRPDITFAVNKLSQFLAAPRTSHLYAAHHVLQYLKGTPGQGLFFLAASFMCLSAYVDADWGSYMVTKKSTSGFFIFWVNHSLPGSQRSSQQLQGPQQKLSTELWHL